MTTLIEFTAAPAGVFFGSILAVGVMALIAILALRGGDDDTD